LSTLEALCDYALYKSTFTLHYIDITGPHLCSSRQNQYILTCVCHFSKWAEAIPIRNHAASTVARALMVNVFSRFGAPRQLLSDRGQEFESELFSELMKWMEIDKLRTTAYQLSTNGAVERFHRTLNSLNCCEKWLASHNVIGMTGCPLYSPLTGLHHMNQRALPKTDYSSVGKLEYYWICF